MLELRTLSVIIGSQRLLDIDHFRVAPGTLVWVQGASGTGKSTFLRALARLVETAGGTISLAPGGTWQTPHAWRARVTLLPQPIVPLGRTIREDFLAPHALRVRRGHTPPSDEDLARELAGLDLAALGLGRPTAELSQGQMARVATLRTILARPELMLLDEPTANMDPAAARLVAQRVLAFVRGGAAAVVAAHSEPWPGVDRRYRMEAGALREVPA